MKVKELTAQLANLNPESDVIGFCACCKNDFHIHGADADSVVDFGSDNGFHTEHGLRKFPTRKVSMCDAKPIGETVAVIH